MAIDIFLSSEGLDLSSKGLLRANFQIVHGLPKTLVLAQKILDKLRGPRLELRLLVGKGHGGKLFLRLDKRGLRLLGRVALLG